MVESIIISRLAVVGLTIPLPHTPLAIGIPPNGAPSFGQVKINTKEGTTD